MNEKDKELTPSQNQKSEDARFWNENKYEREQVESER